MVISVQYYAYYVVNSVQYYAYYLVNPVQYHPYYSVNPVQYYAYYMLRHISSTHLSVLYSFNLCFIICLVVAKHYSTVNVFSPECFSQTTILSLW